MNKMILGEEECFYYLYDKGNGKNKEESRGEDNYMLQMIRRTNNNYIYVYNKMNGFKAFPFYKQYLNDANLMLNEYNDFINNNFFPYSQPFDYTHINELFSRKKPFLIFSYETETELSYFQSISNTLLITNQKIRTNKIILFLNITAIPQIPQKSSPFTPSLKFSTQTGIYMVSKKFKSYELINPTELNDTQLDISEKFPFNQVIIIINEYIKNELNNKTNLYVNNEDKDNILLEAIIRQHLKEIKNRDADVDIDKVNEDDEGGKDDAFVVVKPDEPINKKLIAFPFYLVVYSILFYFGFRKLSARYYEGKSEMGKNGNKKEFKRIEDDEADSIKVN